MDLYVGTHRTVTMLLSRREDHEENLQIFKYSLPECLGPNMSACCLDSDDSCIAYLATAESSINIISIYSLKKNIAPSLIRGVSLQSDRQIRGLSLICAEKRTLTLSILYSTVSTRGESDNRPLVTYMRVHQEVSYLEVYFVN